MTKAMRIIVVLYALFVFAAVLVGTFLLLNWLWPIPAFAHMAQSGWNYPISCCSGYDCRQVAASRIKEGPDGYHVPSGEVIPYGDKRVKVSQDEFYHWCTPGGRDKASTICLFVPPRIF